MDLTQVLSILEAAGIDLTGREIAEAVWLAQFLPQLPVSNSLNETQDINDTREFVGSNFAEEAERAPSEVPERESGTDLYSNNQTNTSTSNIVPAAKVRIYSGRALPNARAIARALRPLMRRIPSKIDYELDEKATAQQIAEKYLLNLRVWMPHLKPAPTRWLEVALVVDSSTSMAVWQPVADELYSLLVRQGAFRDIRMWRLDTESEMAPQLFYANNDIESAPRSYQELFDASGKRLIIVLSDCVSKAWQNRRMFSWLAKLAARANVTILQVWPQRLWKRTILGYVNTLVSAREPALPNTQLIVEQRSAFGLSSKFLNKVTNEPKRVPIPIVALEPHAISNWARMVAGVGNVWAPAIQVEIDSSLQDNQDLENQDVDNNIESDPRYLVEHFQATALPLTQKLAGLLASVPLQLPIMRLIQNSLLPSSEILHLSEFLTSGLIYRVQDDTDNPIFEFVEGVRDLLRRTVSISESVKALQEVGEYINEHFGEGEGFAALIPNVNGVESLVLKEQTIPFAQLQAEVLESLGGIHRFTAQQLRDKISQYEVVQYEETIFEEELLNEYLQSEEFKIRKYFNSLLYALRWTDGFGLMFVRCSPVEGEKIISRIKSDIPDKNVQVLNLNRDVENFYQEIEQFPDIKQVDILFIQNIELSLLKYEEAKKNAGWSTRKVYTYSWKGVPPIFINLNQQRERLKSNFSTCFIFLVPKFVLRYFIQRAPDFLDWRSGYFDFSIDADTLQEESSRILEDADYQMYLNWAPELRNQRIVEIQELLQEYHQTLENKAKLFRELGRIYDANKEYEEAISSYDKALEIKPDYHEAWNSRGIALHQLGRLEEAIISYDKALEIKPDYHKAWNSRGITLHQLGRLAEAIISYDKALEIKPDEHRAWCIRGDVLRELGRIEEAILSYDKALEIKPDEHRAWYIRGDVLRELGRIEEAILSYDKALEIKSDEPGIFYDKACIYALHNNVDLAIENLQQAISLNPEECKEWAKTESDFDNILTEARFQRLIS